MTMASDGQLARSVGIWSKEKLHYVQRYCDIFSKSMKRKWSTRVYIDLFSGPGRCVIRHTGEEIDGSPTIAAACVPGFTDLFVNDRDTAALSALRQRLDGSTTASVHYFSEDCNAAARSIGLHLADLSPSSQLSLCFIDPTSCQIHFESVAALTRGRRMDLIVVFQIGGMKRALYTKSPRITRFFGDDPADPKWYRLYVANGFQGRGLTRVLLDHYQEKLARLGYVGFHDEVSVELNNDGVPLYHMLFASKHPRGKDFWKKVAGKQHTGQYRLVF